MSSDDYPRRGVFERVIPAVNYSVEKAGRNDPCPCGSGKKHKKCCIRFVIPDRLAPPPGKKPKSQRPAL